MGWFNHQLEKLSNIKRPSLAQRASSHLVAVGIEAGGSWEGNHISDDGAGKLVHGLVQGASHVQQVIGVRSVFPLCVFSVFFNGTHFWGESKFMQIYGNFEGFPAK